MRYFTPWMRPTEWEDFHLPRALQKIQGSTHVLFGDCVVSTPDSCFGAETCEEMWSPEAPREYLIYLPLIDIRHWDLFTDCSDRHPHVTGWC